MIVTLSHKLREDMRYDTSLLDMEVKINLVSILLKYAAWKTTREPPTLPCTSPHVLNRSSKCLPLHM